MKINTPYFGQSLFKTVAVAKRPALKEGEVEIIYPNGDHYRGQVRTTRTPHGTGTYTPKGRAPYTGIFRKGVFMPGLTELPKVSAPIEIPTSTSPSNPWAGGPQWW